MNFLEKLNYLMDLNGLNKSTLSKACNIPYTTIDGWYKKGYKGLKLTTLQKLSNFFGTSLDYWINDNEYEEYQNNIKKDMFNCNIDENNKIKEALDLFKSLRPEFQDYVLEQIKKLSELQDK